MNTPKATEIVATKKAKKSEFRKRTGMVAGILMLRARTQLARVRVPPLATGESDQKLPKTRAQIGRRTINPMMTMRVRDTNLKVLELYTAASHDVVPDLLA